MLNEGVVSTSAVENEAALGIRYKENILMTKWYFKKPKRFSERNRFSQHSTNSILGIYIMCTETYTASSGRGWYFFLFSLSSRGDGHVVDLLHLTACCC